MLVRLVTVRIDQRGDNRYGRFGSQAACRQSITPPAAFECIPATQRLIFQVYVLSVCFHRKRPLDRANNDGTDRLLTAVTSIGQCNT